MNKNSIRIHSIFLGIIAFCSFLFSCDKTYKVPAEIEAIPVEIKIERFDQQFVDVDENKLKILKSKYPYLFPKQYTDEFWVNKSKDTLQLELQREVNSVFPNLNIISDELTLFYKHLLYYYPEIKVPEIVSLISEVDYKNNIVLRKELLLISLDTYLGSSHYFYDELQKFIRKEFEPDQILPNVAMEYAKKIIPRADNRDFLAQMILFGKRIYLLNKVLPKANLKTIMSYSDKEMEWLLDNELNVWRYFIDKKMLFSTDKELLPRFIYPAPFSKFYLEYDRDSPARVGQYLGYKIVVAFMENNRVSLQQLMEIDSKTIFDKSKYKPKK